MTRSDNTIFVSQRGYQTLLKRQAALREEYRGVCDEREVAHELSGDGWHDNPHFNYLQQVEANLTHKIATIDRKLDNLQVFEVQDGERPSDRVRLGSIVHIHLYHATHDNEYQRVFEVGGHGESAPDGTRIAYNVPLVRSVLGESVGFVNEVQLPTGPYEVEIVALYRSVLGIKLGRRAVT